MYLYLITFFLACLIIILPKKNLKIQKVPPGPREITSIDSIVQRSILQCVNPTLSLHKLSKYYGEVIAIQSGTVPAVVVSDPELIQNVIANEDCPSRLLAPWILHRSFGTQLEFLASTDNSWQESYKYLVKNVHNVGVQHQNSMEQFITEEFTEFISSMKYKINSKTGVINMTNIFTPSILNIVWSMFTGKRYPTDDPRLGQILALILPFMKSQAVGMGYLATYPFLESLFPNLIGFDEVKNRDSFQDFFKELMEKTADDSLDADNVVEFFLETIDNMQSDPQSFLNKNIFKDEKLLIVLLDLFLVGSETTSNSLNLAILLLTLNPEVQNKVRQEIEEIVGSHHSPNLEDMKSMKYTQATILEIFRYSIVVPISPRRNSKELSLGNYTIPENTLLFLNSYSLLMDEKAWKDPEIFQPERFLDANGNIVFADKLLIFGGEKRFCLGEMPAQMILFSFITGVLQKFKFDVDDSLPKPIINRHTGFSLSPKPYTVICQEVACKTKLYYYL